VFGPVLHVATFRPRTSTRDRRHQRHRLRPDLRAAHPHRRPRAGGRRAHRVGNVYVNRNQIGAIVGSQPFGGEGPVGHRAEGRRPGLRRAGAGGAGTRAGLPGACGRTRVSTGAEGLDGTSQPDARHLPGIAAVCLLGGPDTARALRQALARRDGPILPLITAPISPLLRDRTPPVHRHDRLGRQRLASRAAG
jgi:RHH-type proline utilization regulon transcriptional repressor/proline dehydrogenase/delta 1-pyrroline-5-carboxylate dehydrogenase